MKNTFLLVSGNSLHIYDYQFKKSLNEVRNNYEYNLAPVFIPLVGCGEIGLVHHTIEVTGCSHKEDFCFKIPKNPNERIKIDLERISKFRDSHDVIFLFSNHDDDKHMKYMHHLAKEIKVDGKHLPLYPDFKDKKIKRDWYIGPIFK